MASERGAGPTGRGESGAAWAERRLREAMAVLRRLPGDERRWFRRARSSWPEYRLDHWERLWAEFGPLMQAAPDMRTRLVEVDPARVDAALEAVLWLTRHVAPPRFSEGDRKVVSARASGVTWRRIEDMDGRSRETLRGVYRRALDVIAREARKPAAAGGAKNFPEKSFGTFGKNS